MDDQRSRLCRQLEESTTLLSILSNDKFTAPDVSPAKPTTARDWEILSALTAIANLLVRSQEVVAVAAKDSAVRELLITRNFTGVKSLPEWEEKCVAGKVNYPIIHIIETPTKASTSPESHPIEYANVVVPDELSDKTPVEIYRKFKSAPFEIHVAVVGYLINEIVGDASADVKRLMTFVVMTSVGKLGKRLNGVYARAFLDSEIHLNDDLERVIQVGPLEARAVSMLIRTMKISPDKCKNLTGQLESGCVSKEGLMEAWSLLIHTVQELKKRQKILDKRLKKKTATDKEITTATRDVVIVLLLLNEVAYGNLVNYLMDSQVQVLDRSLERERTRRTGLAMVKVEGAPKEAPSSPQVEQVDGDDEAVLEEDEEDEDLQDDIDIHSMKTEESAGKGFAPSAASSVQIRTWLRLLATSVNSTISLVDQKRQHNTSRKIVFNVLLCDQPSIQVDWKRTIYDIFKNGAKTLIRKLRNEFPVLTDDRLDFSGSPHCEASLGALCSAATMRKEAVDGQQTGLLSRMSPALNVFGISKLCCPVCWLILGHLNQDRPVITSGYHTKFIPCTFPPHLPIDVMERVVAIVQGHLKIALFRFTPKAASSHRRKEFLAAQAQQPPTESQGQGLYKKIMLRKQAKK